MKKIIYWAVGILLLLGIFGNSGSSGTQIQDTQAVVNTVEVTSTEAPTPTPTIYQETQSSGLSNNNYYTNSAGNDVHSPAYSNSVPAGASAICGDGTYSFSQSRRGTCSHHGGVAQWL
jgi:hypothetical protein